MVRRFRYRDFSIAPGLSVMLTGVGRRLQGTCWSTLIFFWRDIFEPYMSHPHSRSDPNGGSELGARLYTGTLYLFFFFSKLNLYLWVYKQFL